MKELVFSSEQIIEKIDRCLNKANLNMHHATLDEDEIAMFYIDTDGSLYYNDAKTPYKANDFKSVKFIRETEFAEGALFITFNNGDSLTIEGETIYVKCGRHYMSHSLYENTIEIFYEAFYRIYELNSRDEFVIENQELLYYNGNDETIIIPEGVEKIFNFAFANCRSLKEVTFPSTLQVIERFSFSQCSSLEKCVFNEGLQKIKRSAFERCVKLKNISIPQSTILIENYAFSHSGVVKVNINNKSCKIKENAFDGTQYKPE